jgi:hypothetical protein
MPNALSRESGLDQAIDILNALNRSTRGRGTVRLHLPAGALTHAPPAKENDVWQGLSFDYATYAEAEHAGNVLQSVYSAHAERHTGTARMEVELHGTVLVMWLAAPAEEELEDLVGALVRRLRTFE